MDRLTVPKWLRMDRQVYLHGEVSIEWRIETGKREMYLHCLNFQFKRIAITLFEEISSSTSIFYMYLTSSHFKVFTVLYHRFSLMKLVFMERFKNKRWISSCFISASNQDPASSYLYWDEYYTQQSLYLKLLCLFVSEIISAIVIIL